MNKKEIDYDTLTPEEWTRLPNHLIKNNHEEYYRRAKISYIERDNKLFQRITFIDGTYDEEDVTSEV